MRCDFHDVISDFKQALKKITDDKSKEKSKIIKKLPDARVIS